MHSHILKNIRTTLGLRAQTGGRLDIYHLWGLVYYFFEFETDFPKNIFLTVFRASFQNVAIFGQIQCILLVFYNTEITLGSHAGKSL